MGRLLPFLLLLFAATLRGDPLAAVQHARTLLGEEVQSRVLRIECKPDKRRATAPVYALVFVLEGRLWFYNATEGTQSLSLEAGRVERDLADPAPLLRVILAGFVRYDDVSDLPISRDGLATPLPNGCFIECLARWRALRGSQIPSGSGCLLAFYSNSPTNPRGHTVLLYERNGRRFVYDPDSLQKELSLPASTGPEPLQIARAVCFYSRNSPGWPGRAQSLTLHPPAGLRDQALLASQQKPTPAGGSGRPLGAPVN